MDALIDLLKDLICAGIIAYSVYYYGRTKLQKQHDEDITKLKNDYKIKLIETQENAVQNYIDNLPSDEHNEHEKLLAFNELLQAVDLIEYTYNEFLKYSPKTHEWKIHVIPWRERLGYRVEKARQAINRFHGY
jgi:hypothetical protein